MKCKSCGTMMAEHGYDCTYNGRCPECLADIVGNLPCINELNEDGTVTQTCLVCPGIPSPVVYANLDGSIAWGYVRLVGEDCLCNPIVVVAFNGQERRMNPGQLFNTLEAMEAGR